MNDIESLCKRLVKATKVSALTGAGISAESGIPTFRGKDGIWKKFKPEELANFDAFMRNPELVWEWYQMRKDIVHQAEPNDAHKALVEFERFFPHFTLITQNIDNLHCRAGSTRVLELHGNIERTYCSRCGTFAETVELSAEKAAPRCSCGGLLRPDVVWFGEPMPEDIFRNAQQASLEAEFFFVIGTSAIVYPAASLPFLAKRSGACLIEVNIEPTAISSEMDYSIMGNAGETLKTITHTISSLRSDK
jgi:NAD-dependent deacetylase